MEDRDEEVNMGWGSGRSGMASVGCESRTCKDIGGASFEHAGSL